MVLGKINMNKPKTLVSTTIGMINGFIYQNIKGIYIGMFLINHTQGGIMYLIGKKKINLLNFNRYIVIKVRVSIYKILN